MFNLDVLNSVGDTTSPCDTPVLNVFVNVV